MADEKQDAPSTGIEALETDGPETSPGTGEISLALPDVQLHEIPPTPNYRATLEKAQTTSRIKSPLPRFFNPLFRSQGTVNTLIIDALNQVGGFVKTLAEEIQIRDRLLEKMVDHVNRQGRGAGQRLDEVNSQVEEIQDAVSHLREHAETGDTRLKNLGDEAHGRISGLVSALRANDSRLHQIEEEVQETAPAIREQLEFLQQEVNRLTDESTSNGGDVGRLTRELEATRGETERLSGLHASNSKATAALIDRVEALETRMNDVAGKKELGELRARVSAGLARLEASERASEAESVRIEALQNELGEACRRLADETIRRAELEEATGRIQADLNTRADSLASDLIELQDAFNHLGNRLTEVVEKSDRVQEQLDSHTKATGTDLETLRQEHRQIVPVLTAIESSMRAGDSSLNEMTGQIEAVKKASEELSGRLEAVSQTGRAQDDSVRKVAEEVGWARQEIALRRADEAAFLDEVRSILKKKITPRKDGGTAAEKALARLAAKKRRQIDSFYTAFEDRFRGSREQVKDKTRAYLSHVRRTIEDLGINPAEFRLLDVGCGRGEWLELLREEGIEAQGVDLNRSMVETCRRFRLPASEADGLAYLRKERPRSFTGISAFHVIEHLPLGDTLEFFNLVQRALKPGGILILETPNPENFRVGSYTFNFDATHRKPVPPELMRFYGEQSGLEPVETIRLNQYAKIPGTEKSPGPFLSALFDGPLDYGTVFRKRS